MSERSSEAGLDQDQVKEAPQGRGILLGFCYHPDQDNQDEYAVFGTLNMKGQLVPVMRHGYRVGDDLQLSHTNLNTIIDFSIITFERHLVCFNRDVGALTEYCRICIRHLDQKVPLSSFVAVKQTKRAMATKRLEEAAEELGWKLSSARPYIGNQTEGIYKTIGALLPVVTSDVLEQWTDFFRRNGCVEEDIRKGGSEWMPRLMSNYL
ncbi:uncharacterized protein RAG0_13661 [Rhynchosporium agropyri]|uniref:Uncharacterized protein n=1 Tax=Rhynchosporium agropyri TaxID=914238 RepID=A0A1E1LDP5_9HELO|nr:uncharacterized protein RAG0_13661 [Rhynchosporium agropyri]